MLLHMVLVLVKHIASIKLDLYHGDIHLTDLHYKIVCVYGGGGGLENGEAGSTIHNFGWSG